MSRIAYRMTSSQLLRRLWPSQQEALKNIPSIYQVYIHHKLCRKNIHMSAYNRQQEKPKESGEMDVRRENPYEHLSFGQKVAQAGTDLTYVGVIIVGIGVTGILFYTIGSELFSTSGPTAVFNASMKRINQCQEALDSLGEPVSAHGETSRRGRRQRVISTEFNKDGEDHTRIRFYVKGQFRTAVVHAEVYKNENGKREFEYLIVECDGYPPKTITVEKREKQNNSLPSGFM